MESQTKPRKIYQNHRENQRERILETAEKLFIRDGIDSVTIAQIAAAARISRVTLYEYFPDKQEIAWAVFQKVFLELRGPLEQSSSHTESGYQKIEKLLLSSVDGLETHREPFRFIALFNFLYAREGSYARMRGTLEGTWPGYYGMPAEWIREGIADGSVRPDLDPGLATAAIFNLMAGMTSRFALLGTTVEEEYGYGVIELFREICRNFLRGIRAA
jgi:AcrR family transcriptional regulator